MIAPRSQLAVYSPIRARSILAGLRPLFGHRNALKSLTDLLRTQYAADAVVLVDSGTNALQLAMESAIANISGTPIIALPGFSCFDIATAAVGANAKVILYDIEPGTLAPDEDSLRKALGAGAQIVVVAPLYGMPVPWDRLRTITDEQGALLVEDAAQGHGASWNERPLGSLGTLSVLSFGRGKGWTGGSGGAVLTRHGATAPATPPTQGVIDARTLAGLTAQWAFGRPSLYALPKAVPGLSLGETVYHDPRDVKGMAESAATSLLANHDVANAEAKQRRANAAALLSWIREIKGLDAILPVRSAEPGYLRLPIRIRNGQRLSDHWDAAQRHGIARSYPRPLRQLRHLRTQLVEELPTPGADFLATALVTLPSHSLVSTSDVAGLRAILTGL